MISLRYIPLGRKLWFIIFVAVTGMLVLSAMSLLLARRSLLAEKKLQTRHLVEVAHSIASFYQQRVQSGELTGDEGKRRTLAVLRGMRYGQKEYFWVNDMRANMVMHPIMPQLEGTDVSTLKDSKGKLLIVEFVETVRSGGAGFVYYYWPKPGTAVPVPKLSYVKGFEPWGWVVGSGVYIDEINALFWKSAGRHALIDGVVALAILTMSWLLARNITSTEEARRLSEEKYIKAFQISPDGFAISRRKDGLFLEVNDAFARMFGFERHEVVGRTSFDLQLWLSLEDRERLMAMVDQQPRLINQEIRLRARSRTILTVQWSSEVLLLQGEEYLFVLVRDITADKDKQRALLKSKAELSVKHEELTSMFAQVEKAGREWEQTMDSLQDMVLLLDGQGNIRRCNRALAEFTGRSIQEIPGENWLQLVPLKGIETLSSDKSSGEFHYAEADRWFFVAYHPYGSDHSSGAVVAIHETTLQKQAAMELEQAYAELKTAHSRILQQEKMASIGQLAAGVAHEINNPIGFIMSNLGTMGKYVERITSFLAAQGELITGLGEERETKAVALRAQLKIDRILADMPALLAESLDGAERVKKIVQDLKSFSRVDEAEDKVVDLVDCLESTINIVWNELKYKVTLVRDFGPLPPVRCRPQQLNQVFMNLLVNAAHAIEHQGEIKVKTWQDGDMACIAVTDSGVGIPEENRNRIFEPFFTTKEVGKGTGLGLSISYEIVKKHGGELTVESEVGKGTTFTIRIPVNAPV